MPTKTVLTITPFALPNIGGAETHVDKLRSYLVSKGWRCITATYQPLTTPVTAPSFEAGDGYSTYRQSWFGNGWFNTLETWPFPFVFLYLIPGLLWISLRAAWENRFNIRVVHAHGLVAVVVARILKRLFGFRVVVSTHAIYGLMGRPLLTFVLRRLFQNVDFVLAVGEPSEREMIRYVGVNPGKIDVHNNWVNLDIFRLQKGVSEKDNWRIALFVGRLIKKKGIREFVEASRRLPDWRFRIVGDGPDKFTVGGLANLMWVGRIPNNSLVNEYRIADVTVLPSQYDEGFSAVVCESLACGTPVMVPRRGVLPHVLTEDVATFIEPTPEGIVKALSEWIPQDREKCRAFAEKHFSIENGERIERALKGCTCWSV